MAKIIPIISKYYIKNDGTCKVYLQVFLQKRRLKIPTDINIEPIFWDKKSKRISEQHPKEKELNARLIKEINKINDVIIKYILKEKTLTPEILLAEIINPSKEIDFIEWMGKEIRNRKNSIEPGTLSHHKAVLQKITEFREHLIFSELSPDFLIEFERFLKIRKKNKQTTIYASIKVLKTYVKIALRREMIEKNPFENHKTKRGKSKIIYLNQSELKKIWEYFYSDNILKAQKRALIPFLFSCTTGLRLSDIKRLRWSDIINDIIYIIPKKTKTLSGQSVRIPLIEKSKKLLEYVPDKKYREYVFDMQSDQVVRREIKGVVKKLEIKKDISFHTARHTFATIFWEKTKDIATLQKLLGHADIQMTMVYAHVSDEMLLEQMKAFES